MGKVSRNAIEKQQKRRKRSDITVIKKLSKQAAVIDLANRALNGDEKAKIQYIALLAGSNG